MVSHPDSTAPPVLSCLGSGNLSFPPQHSITLVPMEEFSPEFVEPRVFCVSSHGTFNPSRYWAGRGWGKEQVLGLEVAGVRSQELSARRRVFSHSRCFPVLPV